VRANSSDGSLDPEAWIDLHVLGDHLDACHPRRRRALFAASEHFGDTIRIAGEYRLNRPVAAVAHPAVEAQPRGLVLDPRPETNPLHAALYADVNGSDR
jgi:hypothetical protein